MNAGTLLFILDLPLRRKIEDAIETSSFLYLLNQGGTPSPGMAKENRRMIILYSASIIEAILLHLFKRKGFVMPKVEYTKVHTLPPNYQLETGLTLVMAKQLTGSRSDRELMLDNLLKFFYDQGPIKLVLKEKIDRARNVRNTFHLSKSRKGIQCGDSAVQSSFDAVLGTIRVVRAYLIANP